MISFVLLTLLFYLHISFCSYCPPSKTVTLNPHGRPISCHSFSDCPASSQCFRISGYCCEDLVTHRPECPQGMSPIKVSQIKLLQCKITDKTTCPNGSVCIPNSTNAIAYCCAPDPTEGCATGSRALRIEGSNDAVLCNPSTQKKADSCPLDASCQWNFNLKQYQCCEPDDGCPRSHRPMLDEHSVIRICDPSKNLNCPRGGVCWYNFWHGKFQCCQSAVESMCPSNMVSFLSPDGPITCGSDKDCPDMYICHHKICCGHPGTCPLLAYTPARDEHGKLRPCFAPGFVDCPGDSICEPALYAMRIQHPWKQQLCCSKAVLMCSEGGTPYPSPKEPMPCDRNKIDSCPVDTKCQASNVPKTFICCRTKIQNNQLCPNGWILEYNQLKYCKPSSNDCKSSCLLSPQTRQFICCSPLMRAQSRLKQYSLTTLDRDYTCPLQYVGPEIQNRQERQCLVPGVRGDCSAGFICATTLEDVNVNICCGPSDNQKDESRFRCPNPGQVEVVENGKNRFCDAYSNDCPRGSTCHSAMNSYQMMICCFSATSETPLCPADSLPQPSTAGYVPCDLNRGSQCDNGYLCVPSVNQPQSSICCSRVNPNAHICPSQQSLYLENGRPRVCSLQQVNPCPTGFTCSQSVSNVGTYICCSLSSTSTCPARYTVVIGVNGAPIHCNVNNPNDCPADSQCLWSPNQVQNAVCCQSSNAPRVCPEGMSALLLPNSQVEKCTGPGSACPVSGYTCELSNYLSTWVCCGRGRDQILCPNGDVPYSQQLGNPYRCNPFTFPTDCPANYGCQTSSQAGVNVCCPSNSPGPGPGPNPTPEPFPPFEPTLRPPTSDLTCPTGWSPYEDSEGAYHFCQHPLDRQCPQGFSCTQSSVSGVFVCCRLAASLQCSNPNVIPYIINNAPRLCTLSNTIPNPCPFNFSCQPSNVAQVHICCPLNSNVRLLPPIQINRPVQSPNYGNQISCMDGSIPAYVGMDMVQCNYLNTPDCCPPTYTCSLSTQRGINVCCHSQLRLSSRKDVKNVCRENSIVIDSDDSKCYDSRECPGASSCHLRPNDLHGHCCLQLECKKNYELMSPAKRCGDDNECGENGTCQGIPAIEEVKVCCIRKNILKPRCIGSETLLHSGHSISCTLDVDCPRDYKCSNKTTNGDSVCCAMSNEICPDNRVPYKNMDDLPIKCTVSELTSVCPRGYICKTGPSGDSFCCSFIAFCPPGKVPQMDETTNHAKKCQKNSECSAGYSCGPSSVENIQICCSSNDAITQLQSQTDDLKLWTIMEG